jgi:hypothetical protein
MMALKKHYADELDIFYLLYWLVKGQTQNQPKKQRIIFLLFRVSIASQEKKKNRKLNSRKIDFFPYINQVELRIQLNYSCYAMFRKKRERKHKREKKNLCCERLFR